MMYWFFFTVVVFCLFFNTEIPLSFGFEGFVKIFSTVPIVIYFAARMVTKKIHYSKDAIYVVLLAVAIIIFKWTFEQDYTIRMITLLIIPMLISMSFEKLNGKELNSLRLIMIIFFLAECGLAIVEWTLNRNFFLTATDTIDYWISFGFFRSSSLLGHPLGNGQVVAVLMTFIAVCDFKRKYTQILLLILGYVSLYCFNARGATIVVTLFTVPYFIWKMNSVTQRNKKWIINASVFCMVLGMFFVVTQTKLGGRLMNTDIMDSSGQTRLDVFSFYKHYNSSEEFLWGAPELRERIAEELGTTDIENGTIAMILSYGIIFTILMLFLLFRFQYNKLSVFSKIEKWLLLAVFFIIGNMNPNIMVSVQWVIWVLSYYAFRPVLTPPQTVKSKP